LIETEEAVSKTPFRNLPFTVRIASFLIFFWSWVLIAELVIDRHGLDRFLPFYRVGNFCPYEVIVIGLLVLLWIRLHRVRDEA
jgi:hypothetical protein